MPETDTNGLFKNMSNTIDAASIKGSDAYETYNSIYSNGEAVRCTTPNGEIVNTGWLSRGTLAGPMNIVFYGKSNVSGGTNFVQIYIYRRDNEGNISLRTSPYWDNPKTFFYFDERGLTLGRNMDGFFDIQYDYKIVIKTDYALAAGKYVDIDWLQITPVPAIPLRNGICNAIEDVDIDGGYVFVPGGERVEVEVTGTGATTATKTYTTTNYYGNSTVVGACLQPQMLPWAITNPGGTNNSGTIGLAATDGTTFTGTWGITLIIKGRVILPNF